MRITCAITVLLLSYASFAHGEETPWQKVGIPDPLNVLFWVFAISAFVIAASVYYKDHIGMRAKKLAFICIAAPIMLGVIYLAGTTIYLNIKSVTGGPVHWHADYEVWACGRSYELMDPEDLSNKVGSEAVHEHNDNRMHVEGIIFSMEDASIGEFFEAVGGEMAGGSLSLPTPEGIKEWKDGNFCSGMPAKWYMFVNSVESNEWGGHIIAPYPDVPPGDRIKLVFTEKPAQQISAGQFEVP